MTRITWTKAEKDAVAVRAFEIKNYASFDDSDIEAVRQAMAEQLSDKKQRQLKAMADVPWVRDIWENLYVPHFEEALNSYIEAAKVAKEVQTSTAPTKPQAIIPVVNPKVERESLPQLSPQDFLKEVPTLDLWAELGSRINQLMSGEHLKLLIRQEVNTTLERRIPGLLPPDEFHVPVEQPKEEQRVKKLKVAVIGLLNGQQELIKNEYRTRIDFLFLEKTPSLQKIKHTASQYDFVLQMLKFSDQIKGSNQIENFHSLGGLLTQLREFLNRHVCS